MKLQKTTVYLMGIILLIGSILFLSKTVQGYYACGGNCSLNVNGCAPGVSCVGGVCGTYYNACIGVNKVNCSATGGWDNTSCNKGDTCDNAGTTRTVGWTAYSACTVSCGEGTQTRTCNCTYENNCFFQCQTPTTDCGGTNTVPCCFAQVPQKTPEVTVAGGAICSKSKPIIINWTFDDTGSGCDLSWGVTCSAGNKQANTNTFIVKVDGNINTKDIPSTTRSVTISTATGTSHQIQVCANNGSAEVCSPNFKINIDDTAPPKPTGTMIYTQDPDCKGKYKATYSWNAVTDTGCGSNNIEYWAQGSSSNAVNVPDGGFKTILTGWDLNDGNTWGTVTTRTAAQSYPPGTKLYFHVQSRDAIDNQSGWTAITTSNIIPTPSPLPPIHVDGPLIEDVSGACYGGITVDPANFVFQPILNPSDGILTDCKITTGGTQYSCDFTIDNQHGTCYDNKLQVQLSGTYPGYGIMGWHLNNTCEGDLTSIDFIHGQTASNVPLYLEYGGSDPTDGNWFKLSNTSFNSRLSGRNNVLPRTFLAFDSDDSTSNRNIMLNSSGVLVQNSPMVVGTGAVSYSTNNWYTSGYQYANNDVSYQEYVGYLKARKDFKAITDITQITTDGIYSMTAPINLVDAHQFDGRKVVLVVEGEGATTFGANFIPTGGSVVVLGTNIQIDPTVTEIDAVIIGETVATGDSSSSLKIKGNLIDESALPIERSLADKRKPSLFVTLDTKIYLDVLPYLSTSTYDWRQIQ
ncbi:MAG: hypothetical protein NTV98_04740 [Candidatus Roizmanbacteria bacterium]|nr:hypothetical protein [Candidatus Roizmanbacteria bacterium]